MRSLFLFKAQNFRLLLESLFGLYLVNFPGPQKTLVESPSIDFHFGFYPKTQELIEGLGVGLIKMIVNWIAFIEYYLKSV